MEELIISRILPMADNSGLSVPSICDNLGCYYDEDTHDEIEILRSLNGNDLLDVYEEFIRILSVD